MKILRKPARGRLTERSIRSPRRSITVVATLAVSLSMLGAVVASSATAAPGDGVIAWVEVEDGAISGGPARDSGDHGNFSGNGSYTFRETGMTSTMSVTAPAAGVYPIHVRYAAGPLSPAEDITRSMGLLTNGGSRQQMQLPLTGDWETWKFVTYSVTLNQGANTVAIQCDRSTDFCRLNFDAIQVGGEAPDACAATPASPGYTSLFDGTFVSFDRWRKAGGGGFGRQTDCTIQTFRGRGAEWLTASQTAPYTLKLDWRRAAADDESSVYVASGGVGGADPSNGFRIPIGTNTGAVVPTGGTAQAADQTAVTAALRPVGEWNTYTIRLSRSQVVVLLNGTLVNTYSSPATIPASGYLGLENRGASHDVKFKNIQIKQGVAPDPVGSTTAITVAPASVPVNQGTASVSVTVASAGATPTGDVELWVDAARQSTVRLVNGSATATVGPFDTVGTKSVQARYLGDAATTASNSPTANLVVEAAASTTAITVAPASVPVNQGTASVSVTVASAGATPTGDVELWVDAARQSTVRLVNGSATATVGPFDTVGTKSVQARYLGDAATTASNSPTANLVVEPAAPTPAPPVVVAKATPTMTIKAKPKTVVAGRTKAKMAIAVTAPAVAPTGQVTVTIGKKTYAATLAGGKATIKLTRFKKAGTVRATATYLGDALVNSASTTAKVKVKKARK